MKSDLLVPKELSEARLGPINTQALLGPGEGTGQKPEAGRELQEDAVIHDEVKQLSQTYILGNGHPFTQEANSLKLRKAEFDHQGLAMCLSH